MRRAVVVLVLIGSLMGAESASACSCAEDPDEKETLRGFAAAATARLIEIDNIGGPNASKSEYVYRLLRVYKGSGRYRLREGEKLRIESYRDGATCGPPRDRGKRYGLGLYRSRGELSTNLCSVMSPKELRRAAQRSGNARSAAGAGCGSQS